MTTSSRILSKLFPLASVAALLGAVACGAAPGVEADSGAGPGDPCGSDAECNAGLYCGADGTCAADCGPEKACADGLECNERGRCAPGDDPDDVLDTDNPGEEQVCNAEVLCAAGGVRLENQKPTVVVLVDQSGSMKEELEAGGPSRWDVLRDALVSPDTGVIAALQNDVRFGLALYTNDRETAACPELTEVATAFGNYDVIRSVYAAAAPQHDTPTAESLTAVAASLEAFDAPGPKAIVLATDGRPDTCADPDAHDEASRNGSIAAAQGAHARGIATHVVSVGTDVGHEHLGDMANAGAGLPIGGIEQAQYYEVTEQDALRAALDIVIRGVRACSFQLDAAVTAEQLADGSVTIDGVAVPRDDANGWRLEGNDAVRLVGAACDSVKSGDHDVRAEFACPCDQPAPDSASPR